MLKRVRDSQVAHIMMYFKHPIFGAKGVQLAEHPTFDKKIGG